MVSHPQDQIQAAYRYCAETVRSHYENFPVASLLLPKELRLPISVIYTFARNADDFADEGDLSPELRLARLDNYSKLLEIIASPAANPQTHTLSEPDHFVFLALQDVIPKYQLPVNLFQDLLTAFKQDVTKKRYCNFDEVLFYCRHSANPIGRLLLHLMQQTSEQNLQCSDCICTSLQLINFFQDIHQDFSENQRIYLPEDEMRQFNVSTEMIEQQQTTDAIRELLRYQLQRAKTLMLQGAPLGNRIGGRFGLQLRMMINGGLQVLMKLEGQTKDVFSRPRLETNDWLKVARYAVMKKYIQ